MFGASGDSTDCSQRPEGRLTSSRCPCSLGHPALPVVYSNHAQSVFYFILLLFISLCRFWQECFNKISSCIVVYRVLEQLQTHIPCTLLPSLA